ncbi:hypothetical protein STEG23_021002 [Scotinomys teguina]
MARKAGQGEEEEVAHQRREKEDVEIIGAIKEEKDNGSLRKGANKIIFQAKMGRRQGKSAYNIIKNKTTPESSPPPTPKSDFCNADKAEENDLKKSLMKMLEEAFEEKMKNVSKEIGENTNKNWRKSIKKLKKRKAKNWRK